MLWRRCGGRAIAARSSCSSRNLDPLPFYGVRHATNHPVLWRRLSIERGRRPVEYLCGSFTRTSRLSILLETLTPRISSNPSTIRRRIRWRGFGLIVRMGAWKSVARITASTRGKGCLTIAGTAPSGWKPIPSRTPRSKVSNRRKRRRVTVVCLTTVFCGTVIEARETKGPIPNRELGATAALIATDPLLVSALFNSSRLAWG